MKYRKLFGNIDQVLELSDAAAGTSALETTEATQRRIFAHFCRTLNAQPPLPETNTATDQMVSTLAPRVRQTLECLLMGDSEKQVARKLGVSQNTIHVYVRSIYRAFNVSSRGELMTHFVSGRWLTHPDLPSVSPVADIT